MAEQVENKNDNKLYNGLDYQTILFKLQSQKASDVYEIAKWTEKYMKKYAQSIKYTQFRSIHATVKQAKDLLELARLMPRMAYLQARQQNAESKELVGFIRAMMGVVIESNKETNLKVFRDFMDALVAYHKLYN